MIECGLGIVSTLFYFNIWKLLLDISLLCLYAYTILAMSHHAAYACLMVEMTNCILILAVMCSPGVLQVLMEKEVTEGDYVIFYSITGSLLLVKSIFVYIYLIAIEAFREDYYSVHKELFD